jgi:two-component sensor histidine kinase
MRLFVASIVFFMCSAICFAQEKYTAFTVKEGLPSNYIYRCVEDDKGFLWIATDAGVARFDGKRFKIFTTRDGLPDNEILSIVKEKNGRIWANCFKQIPAYFDELQNRFVNAKEDSNLAKISGTAIMLAFPLPDGGMAFFNEKGSFILKNNRSGQYDFKKYPNVLVRENVDGSHLLYYDVAISTVPPVKQAKIFHVQNGMNIDSLAFSNILRIGHCLPAVDDKNFYLAFLAEGRCLKLSGFKTHPLRFHIDSANIPETFFTYSFTDTYVCFFGNSGKIYVYDKKTLQQRFILSGNYAPDNLYNDRKGNLWVSTIDKGLLVYRKKQLSTVPIPENFANTNFLSIARKSDGRLLAGNYYGEVVESGHKVFIVHPNPQSQTAILRQKKILISQNKVFTFSEMGIYMNYKKKMTAESVGLFYAKTAINYNDSIIIVGNVSGLLTINSHTEKSSSLYTSGKRVTALAKAADGMIYIGSTDGLYKYDYANKKSITLDRTDPLLNERIVAIATTPDGLVWLATSGNGVIVVKNDKVFLHIVDKENLGSNSSRSIVAAGPGKIWVGTQEGINTIDYQLSSTLKYTMQHMSANDGLTNNAVNEMLYDKDTVYAATADGITMIPSNTPMARFNILVELTGVSINQKDTILTTYYKLGYDQKNIQMQFAGIELNGHFKKLQYRLDKNEHWIDLQDNTITVILNNGLHNVNVRAVDVNGNVSDRLLNIQFDIATPFWKAISFWVIFGIAIQVITVYFIIWWYKKKKETKLTKVLAGIQTASLEQQAFTSLMNPHFMFNALNSIQHYINLQDRKSANRYLSDFASLIRKNFEAAQLSFIPLEQELENIRIYLRLEQMRFTNRFSYHINIAEDLDIEQWMVPTMMLQPLLENAVLHGIMPSSITGELLIDLRYKDKDLLITITDNGIGVENSRTVKEANGHKSHGMVLIKKRIKALSHFVTKPIAMHMLPAFSNPKNPGNRIVLLIPADLYSAWLQAQHR